MVYIYDGTIGSGKTHHAVYQEILNAVRAGRKVYTNIDGISVRNIAQHLGLPENKVNIELWEGVERIRNMLTLQAEDREGVSLKIERGSIVMIDEAQFVYDARQFKSTPKEFHTLLEYQRHFGIDLIFITPHYKRLDGAINLLCNEHYHVKSLKIFGPMMSSRYIVQVRTTPGGPIITTIRGKYQLEVFRCYKSGVELGRFRKNVPAGIKWMLGLTLALVLYGGGGLIARGGPLGAARDAALKENERTLVQRSSGTARGSIGAPAAYQVQASSAAAGSCHMERRTGRLRYTEGAAEVVQGFQREALVCAGDPRAAYHNQVLATAAPEAAWRVDPGEELRDSIGGGPGIPEESETAQGGPVPVEVQAQVGPYSGFEPTRLLPGNASEIVSWDDAS